MLINGGSQSIMPLYHCAFSEIRDVAYVLKVSGACRETYGSSVVFRLSSAWNTSRVAFKRRNRRSSHGLMAFCSLFSILGPKMHHFVSGQWLLVKFPNCVCHVLHWVKTWPATGCDAELQFSALITQRTSFSCKRNQKHFKSGGGLPPLIFRPPCKMASQILPPSCVVS